MKIVYFITGLQFGGAEIGMARLLNAIEESERRDEFNITVISLVETSSEVVELLPETVEVHQLDIKRKSDVRELRLLCRELRKTDLLICSLYHATVVGVLFGTLLRVPQIFTWQHNSEYRSQTARLLYTLCYRLSDKVLADSQAVETMLHTDFNVAPEKTTTLPIVGVDVDFFTPEAGEISFKNDCPIQVGTVGRVVRQKGHDYLIETAARVDDAHFHVIGDGELREDLEAMCEKKEVSNVSFHGNVPYQSLPEYLSSFDIYFQPSRYEGLCMTVIEAMAAGLPVVASRTGGIQESVLEEETGYLVNPGNIDGYVDRLQVLRSNGDQREEFGKAGRARVQSTYSSEVFLKSFYQLLG